MLKPEYGVDLIIGGHSHTILDKPKKVNDILITQAGVGTNQVGRFDIVVDDDTNSIVDYKWKLIPITSKIAQPDKKLVEYISSFKKEVDRKYNTIVTKLSQKLTHPKREIETSLGNLFADAFAENAQTDIMLLGSGSIRIKELGPLVTLGNLREAFPYDDSIVRFKVIGAKIIKIFEHILRLPNRDGEGECYQLNSKVNVIYSDKEKKLISLKINNENIKPEKTYYLAIQGYHYNNSKPYLNIEKNELCEIQPPKVIATSAYEVLEEFLKNHQNLSSKIENRLIFK
jgi:5'-nucleotidase/UDP-sugar diphosphatase